MGNSLLSRDHHQVLRPPTPLTIDKHQVPNFIPVQLYVKKMVDHQTESTPSHADLRSPAQRVISTRSQHLHQRQNTGQCHWTSHLSDSKASVVVALEPDAVSHFVSPVLVILGFSGMHHQFSAAMHLVCSFTHPATNEAVRIGVDGLWYNCGLLGRIQSKSSPSTNRHSPETTTGLFRPRKTDTQATAPACQEWIHGGDCTRWGPFNYYSRDLQYDRSFNKTVHWIVMWYAHRLAFGRVDTNVHRTRASCTLRFKNAYLTTTLLCGFFAQMSSTDATVPSILHRMLSTRVTAASVHAHAFHSTCGNRLPLLLCSDFDQTISQDDTIKLLFDQASANWNTTNADQAMKHANQVKELVNRYMKESKSYIHAFFESYEPSKTFDEAGMRQFLDGYAKTDMQSVVRVIESRTLSGITDAQLDQLGQSIPLQEGSTKVLSTIPQETCVISTNWSGKIVRAAMSHGFPADEQPKVIANELQVDRKTGKTNGNIDPLIIQAAYDKARVLQSMQTPLPIAYVGDSLNDLMALLEADVGYALAVTSKSSMYKYATAFGIECQPLNGQSVWDCMAQVQKAKQNNQRVIFMANDWHEIETSLLS